MKMDLYVGVHYPGSNYKQFVLLDVDNVQNLILGRDALEKVIAAQGNLSGAMLAPDINVKGLKFASAKMDKAMLTLLIQKGADVCGVNLSGQNLEGMDLTNVNLSEANLSGANLAKVICTGTNFTNATFHNTCLNLARIGQANFTGVDLSTTSLSYASCDGLFVIVSKTDREPYLKKYLDQIVSISNGEVGKIPLTENISGKFDERLMAKWIEGTYRDSCIEYAQDKLLGNGFNPAEKRLFFLGRSVLWELAAFVQREMERKGEFDDSVQTDEMIRFEIYAKEEYKGRYIPELMTACFNAAVDIVRRENLEISMEEIAEVKELFEDFSYNW